MQRRRKGGHPRGWSLAPARKRSKRITKKIAKRAGLMHYLPGWMCRNTRAWIYGCDPDPYQVLTWFVVSRRGNPYPASCRGAGMLFMEYGNRVVAKDWVGDIEVSTVFLSLNHGFRLGGRPVLWETMIFGPDTSIPSLQSLDICNRYRSEREAREGHTEAIALVRRVVAADLTEPVEATVH